MSGPILFLIPARGGSQRVPGKNLRNVGGIPLVGWAARIGRAAAAGLDGGPHRVVCSTDDPAIAAAAAAWGAEVLERPAALATDDATSVDVALHAVETIRSDPPFETLVLLQPTSPLTDPADVVAAVTAHRNAGATGVTSVVSSHLAAWHHGQAADGTLRAIATTGETEPGALLTGAFYVVDPGSLREHGRFVVPGRTRGFVVPPERAIDIDTAVDLADAEARLAARAIRPVPFGDRVIGAGPVFIIAEAGVNHDGDPAVAHALVDAAATAGADAVKFQTFDPDALAAADAPTAAYQEAARAGGDQRRMLAALRLPDGVWPELQAHAVAVGIGFFSTPFDAASADLLEGLDVPAFKVGSGELTNLGFLSDLARRGRSILLSTGMADMVEVAAAVDAVHGAGDPPLALFHCVSSYPAAAADANLRAIETMRRAFGVPVGWSDHTPGMETAVAAVALGASLVEKHLTLDRTRSGPDHRSSLDPATFASLIRAIRETEASLGDGEKQPVASETEIAAVARRSLHWRVDLPAGTEIRPGVLVALRPGTGLRPALQASLLGRRTAVDVRAGAMVQPTDVRDEP